MHIKALSAAIAVSLVATPTVSLACDLDGMPGCHRYNPFAKLSGLQGLTPPMDPVVKVEVPEDVAEAIAKAKADRKSALKEMQSTKPKPRAPRAPQPPRDYERDWGNGPISQEDLATDI